MTRFLLTVAVLVAGILPAPEASVATTEQPRTDRSGDPLPPHAIARLGTRRMRECRGPVLFSPDGKYVVSAGGQDGSQAIFWDRSNGRRVKAFASKGAILRLVYSPDGKTLAATDFGTVWDAATGEQRFRVGGEKVAFDSDGKTLTTAYSLGEKAIFRRYDTADGKQQSEWSFNCRRPGALTLSPNGRLAAVPSPPASPSRPGGQTTVSVFDLRKEAKAKELPVNVGRCADGCSFSGDGRLLAAYGEDGWIIWDWKSGKSLRTWKGRVHNVPVFSPDGERLAWIGADEDGPGIVSLWVIDLAGGRPRSLGVTDTIGWRHPAAFSADGKQLAVVTEGHAVTVVDARTGRDLLALAAHSGPVRSVAYASDNRYVVTRGPFRLLVWEATTGKLLRRYPDDLPDGEKVLLNTAKHGRVLTAELPAGVLRLRDLVTGKEVRRLKGKDGYVSAAPWDVSVISADGKFAAVLGPEGVRIYNLDSGEIRCQFDPEHAVWDMRFTLDKRTLIITIQDYEKGLLTIYRDTCSGGKAEAPTDRTPWNDAEGRWRESGAEAKARLRKLKLLDAAGQPAFASADGVVANVHESPDGRYLAVQGQMGRGGLGDVVNLGPGSNNPWFLRIWDKTTRRFVTELDGSRGTQEIAGFTPDGRSLLSKTYSPATIHLWECATGRERLRLVGHNNGAVRLAFRPDGRALVSGGADTQVLLWDLTSRMPDGTWRQTSHSPEQRTELWKTLTDDDAARAYRAAWSLEAAPAQTLTLLRDHLCPMAAPDPKRLTRLLDDLDSDDFAEREKASRELERLGELAEPALRRVLKERPTLERRRRCEQLLEKLSVLSGDRLRALRAVEVLEHIGTPEARTLLEKLGGGDPAARLTQEARAALKRLAVP